MTDSNTYSKSKIMMAIIKGKIASILGWIFAIFWLIGLIAISTSSPAGDAAAGTIICLIFIAISIPFILYGRKVKYSIKRFRRYVDIIITGNETNIDNIAGTIMRPVDFVISDLQDMINKKYFANAYIDRGTHEIVINNRKENINSFQVQDESNEAEDTNIQIVECKCCGAKNRVSSGSSGICEYCGSSLNIKK